MEKRKIALVAMVLAMLCACSGSEDDGGTIGFDGPKTVVQPCDLLITEIMAKPSTPVTGRRWVEIFNASSEDIDVNRVRLEVTKTDKSPAQVDLRSGVQNVLPAGSFLWVRIGAEPLADEMVEGYYVVDTDKNVALAEEGFKIAIVTLAGEVIHQVQFGMKDGVCDPVAGILPPPVTATDQSMELKAAFFSCRQATWECGAWGVAAEESIPGDTGFGSPGLAPIPNMSLEGDPPIPGDVAVTEIMYRSSDVNGEADWFELVNLSDDWVSLKGCTIGDGTQSGDHTIAESVVLCPGQLVLFSSKLLDAAGVDVDYKFGGKPNLNMSGDTLYLKCPGEGGAVQDIFNLDFSSSGPFPVSGENASVQVCPELLPAAPTAADYHAPTAWAITPAGHTVGTTSDLGTPGEANPGCGGKPDKPCVPECTGGTTCTMLGEEPVCARKPAAGNLVVTEIMTNGSEVCSEKKDWFEVLNLTTDYLLLAGCTLSDDNETVTTLAGSIAVEPGGYLVMVQNSAGCQFDAPNFVCYGGSPNLNTGDDSIQLVCDGSEVFNVNYGSADEIPEPAAGDTGNRVASQLGMKAGVDVTPASAGAVGNWCLAKQATACGDLGTPGTANGECEGGVTPGECEPACTGGSICEPYGEGLVCAWPPSYREVVPTEIMVNGSDPCSGGKDWFEIYNFTTDFLSLTGCKLWDDNGTTYELSQPVAIGPGDYLVFVQASSGCTFAAPRYYCYGGSPNLNSGGDSINMSCGGEDIFGLHYGCDGCVQAPKSVGGILTSTQARPNTFTNADSVMVPSAWGLSCNAAACGDHSSPGLPNQNCQ